MKKDVFQKSEIMYRACELGEVDGLMEAFKRREKWIFDYPEAIEVLEEIMEIGLSKYKQKVQKLKERNNYRMECIRLVHYYSGLLAIAKYRGDSFTSKKNNEADAPVMAVDIVAKIIGRSPERVKKYMIELDSLKYVRKSGLWVSKEMGQIAREMAEEQSPELLHGPKEELISAFRPCCSPDILKNSESELEAYRLWLATND